MLKMEWFVASEDELEGLPQRKATRFRLQIRRRGNEWDWSIYDFRYDTSIASGTAPTIEVAESVVEEIIGQKPEWHSRMA
jgi:hypothetical protein